MGVGKACSDPLRRLCFEARSLVIEDPLWWGPPSCCPSRKNPLHLHLVTNSVAKSILETFFRTWMVPALWVSFYDADELKAGTPGLPGPSIV